MLWTMFTILWTIWTMLNPSTMADSCYIYCNKRSKRFSLYKYFPKWICMDGRGLVSEPTFAFSLRVPLTMSASFCAELYEEPKGRSTKRSYEHSCVRKFLRSCVCFTNCFGQSKFYDVRTNVLNCLRIFLLPLIRQNCHQLNHRKIVTTFLRVQ